MSNHIWPQIIAPPRYTNPHKDWEDPRLPDFELIFKIAREEGYTIALHGSMRRDVDLIAVPWIEKASTGFVLINKLCKRLNAVVIGKSEQKPHGRYAVNLQIQDGYYKLIDLSIMPIYDCN